LLYDQEATYAEFSKTPTTTPNTIGGTVTGLVGTGLVLQLNSTSFPNPIDERIEGKGDFVFFNISEGGTNYDVTVLTQPEGQTCNVINGSGDTSDNGEAVTDILVSCEENPDSPPVIRAYRIRG
jgi:hypothetical protein